jgi:hypothetical protein
VTSTLLKTFKREVNCVQCREEQIAPAWSGQASTEYVRNLWQCAKCGYVFETLDPIDKETAPPLDLAEEMLPTLVVE